MNVFKKKISKITVICFIVLIIGGFSFALISNNASGQSTVKKNILVISKGNDKLFRQSLGVDTKNFNISVISESDPLTLAGIDVVMIFDAILTPSKMGVIESFVDNGGAVLIFMGQKLHNNATLLKNLTIVNSTAFQNNEESMLFVVKNNSYALNSYIDWNSAPDIKVRNMSIINPSDLNISVKRIVDVYPVSKNLEIKTYSKPILMEMAKGNGNVILFTGWLEKNANIDFKVWPYFNYLLYTMIFESLNLRYQTYAAWPFSPVPHLMEQLILLVVVISLAILAISGFVVVKKKSAGRMDQSVIETLKKQVEEEEQKRHEEAKELEKKLEDKIDLSDDWEVIGIHRQLGGFLKTLFLSLFLVIPQLLISNFLMPQIFQPYPQAAGWYYYAYNTFQIAWLLFDFGTSYALAKFFSQYRVKNPEKAIHYIQIFVWWQLFTGLAQISIFALIGSFIFPLTSLAHMSWVFISFSLVQYPGFFLVFMFSFQGMQKADYQLILYVMWEVVWLLVGQMIFCPLGRMWGAANPIFGEALGAGIGYSIARYFDYWMTFLFSIRLFKKRGFSPKTCFRIDFNREEFKETMKFGSRLAFGESFVQITYFIQLIYTSAFIANYSNELGYFSLAMNIGMIVQIVGLWGQSLLGAYSESREHGKKKLTKLYIYQSFRWGNFFAFFLISVLFATGGKFLVGAAGEDYGSPAVRFLPFILMFHSFGIYSWLADPIFLGTGKTNLAALVWIIEQTIRAILMIVLIIWLKDMTAVLLAYIPAVFIKDIIAWIIIRYKITNYRIHPFTTFVTPILAALINYIVLFFFGELIWMIDLGDKLINTALLFIIGIFLFMYFYAFLDGLLGGYDDNTLKEFEKAASMVEGRIGSLPKTLYKAAKAGAKYSPFHNRFKIDIYEEAMKEAYELTLEKKILKI